MTAGTQAAISERAGRATDQGDGGGDGRAEGSPAAGGGARAAVSPTPVGGTVSGSLKEELGEKQHPPLSTNVLTPVRREMVKRDAASCAMSSDATICQPTPSAVRESHLL